VRPPDWKKCMRSAGVGVRTAAVNNVPDDVDAHDAPAASVVAVYSVVSVVIADVGAFLVPAVVTVSSVVSVDILFII
jgi:hypothetical protein